MSAHCQRCHSPLEVEDVRCPICSLAAPEQALGTGNSRARAEIVRCESCGAAVTYAIEQHAPQCVFCGSVTHVERPTDPLEQPDWYLPFFLDERQAHVVLGQWLASQRGWFTPRELASQATLTSLRPLWWVAWVCDADAWITWTADSEYGRRKASWAPHSGATSLSFQSLLVPATRGLTAHECNFLASGFQLGSAEHRARGPVTALAERFDVQRSMARHLVIGAIHRTAGAILTRGHVPGSRFRNLHVSALLSRLTTRRYALPTYVLAYRFKGELHRAVVHGQDARYVTGSVPKDYTKLYVALIVVVGGLVLLFLVLFLIAAIRG